VTEILSKIVDDKVIEVHYFSCVVGNATTDFAVQIISVLMRAKIPGEFPLQTFCPFLLQRK
jgi:hypothetical protein